MKIAGAITAAIFFYSCMVLAQEQSETQVKLNFLVGEWKSVSVNQTTGEESTGNSSIRWVLDGTWLQWKYVGQLEQGTLEVLTLINYHNEKKQYAFYSFNPFDEEPLPHYGNWLDANTLRLEITSRGEKTCVDFKIKENGDFDQEHSDINASGERFNTRKTSYSSACVYQDKFPKLRGPYLGQTPPGMTPEVFAPGIISLGFHENGIVFSSDGNELFYSTSDSKYAFKTFIYLKKEDNGWSTPEMAPFSGNYYDHSAFFSPDGKKMYFSSTRPVSSSLDKKEDLDVWFVEREGDSWGEPVHLEGPLNTDRSEQITSIAANGTIYLRTNYEDGKWGIYISRLENGIYTAAEKLGKTINAGYNEGNPFVSPDERFMLFKSGRPGGYGNTDLYVSFRQRNRSWGEPINLGPKINSPEHELEPRLSPDGKYLFFTSFRKYDPSAFKGKSYEELMELYRSPQNGYGTLYWVDAKIIEEFQGVQ